MVRKHRLEKQKKKINNLNNCAEKYDEEEFRINEHKYIKRRNFCFLQKIVQ